MKILKIFRRKKNIPKEADIIIGLQGDVTRHRIEYAHMAMLLGLKTDIINALRDQNTLLHQTLVDERGDTNIE